MTNEEMKDLIKELREVSHQTAMIISTEVAGFIGKRNVLLRKAADLIENQNKVISAFQPINYSSAMGFLSEESLKNQM